jgi:hypothetical protein
LSLMLLLKQSRYSSRDTNHMCLYLFLCVFSNSRGLRLTKCILITI